MTPIVSEEIVTSAVLPPARAEAAAASQPAWPPPITMTSNWLFILSHPIPGDSVSRETFPHPPRQTHTPETAKMPMFHVNHLPMQN
jgi:hypothetical protein